jgi:hypothetical protein
MSAGITLLEGAAIVGAGALAYGMATKPSVPGALPQSQTDPYGAIGGRTQAANQLMQLQANPSMAMSTPGYQQQLQQGQQAQQAAGAASGTLQSGGQANALNQQAQNTFGSYYQNQLNNLSMLSGANQSPASAGNVQYGSQMQSYNAANANSNQMMQLGMGFLGGAAQAAAGGGSFFSSSGGGGSVQPDSGSGVTAAQNYYGSAYNPNLGWGGS